MHRQAPLWQPAPPLTNRKPQHDGPHHSRLDLKSSAGRCSVYREGGNPGDTGLYLWFLMFLLSCLCLIILVLYFIFIFSSLYFRMNRNRINNAFFLNDQTLEFLRIPSTLAPPTDPSVPIWIIIFGVIFCIVLVATMLLILSGIRQHRR